MRAGFYFFSIGVVHSGHNKWICESECAGHRSHTYIHITAEDQAGPWCTQLQICRSQLQTLISLWYNNDIIA